MELNGTIKAKKTLSGTVLRSTGGGGTSDYEQLSNLPQINDVTLIGNKSSSDLGLADATDIPAAGTATPKALGTAAVGTSTKYAREDHVHAMPTIPAAASSGTPAMDGTASRGSSANFARADHVHPTDTSRAAAADVHSIPAGGSTGQVLKKTSGTDYAVAWANESGGGGGTSDYTDLTNKPSINSVTLSGNKTAADLGLSAAVTEVTNTAAAPSLALDPEKIYHFTGTLTSLTITALTSPASGQLAHYHFDFNSGSTATTLTLPQTVVMPSGFTVEASMHYEIDILNNYGAVMAWANS